MHQVVVLMLIFSVCTLGGLYPANATSPRPVSAHPADESKNSSSSVHESSSSSSSRGVPPTLPPPLPPLPASQGLSDTPSPQGPNPQMPRAHTEPNETKAVLPEAGHLVRTITTPATTPGTTPAASSAPVLSPESLQELALLRIHGKAIQDLRILIVDDNKVIQKLLPKRLIQDLGVSPAHIGQAFNANEGLAQFQSGHYDLVLMDENMPPAKVENALKNGIEATAAIREVERQMRQANPQAQIRAIKILGNSMSTPIQEIQDSFLSAGANGFCEKVIIDAGYIRRLFEELKKIQDRIDQ